MDTLPAEVLHQICCYLQSDHRDVASYRLVCNLFAAVGIEHILPTVHVAYHPQSLARLKDISEHPILRQHVRTVCYLTDTIPTFDDIEAWRLRADEVLVSGYDRHRRDHPHRPPYSKSELENGWKEYQKCKAGQDELWNSDDDVETFVRSVALLPSLRRVAMYDSYHHGSGTEEGRLFHPFDATLVADIYSSNWRRSFGIKQFFTLLSAMKLQPTLRSLEMTRLTWRVFKKLPPVTELQIALSCLSHLRMHITTSDHMADDERELDEYAERKELMSTGCIGRFVASAPNLETIELSFASETYLEHWAYHLPDLIGSQTYFNLRRLALVGVEMSEDSLGIFLHRHAATLKDLELRGCNLTSPSLWFNIFTKVPKILDLEEVVLGECLLVSRGGPFDSLDMRTEIMNSDLCVGRVLEMVLCRNFTQKYGHPYADEEEIRSQVLSDIAQNSPETPPQDYSNEMFKHKIRNTYLMCQLYEKKRDLRIAKLAQQEGYSDPVRYEAQVLFKGTWSEDESSEGESLEDEGSEDEGSEEE